VLTAAELGELESSLLPALERHHLRLLAHALRTLQAISGSRSGSSPDRASITTWAEKQPIIAADPGFRSAFIDQLLAAAAQLESIAAESGGESGGEALALELPSLVAWARRQADQRLSPPRAAAGPPPD
jgi:hypothetical protein